MQFNVLLVAEKYDELNRLRRIEHLDALDVVFASFEYELDEVGNRAAVTEYDGRRVEYEYDELYRLTRETVTGAGDEDFTTAYRYDLATGEIADPETVVDTAALDLRVLVITDSEAHVDRADVAAVVLHPDLPLPHRLAG